MPYDDNNNIACFIVLLPLLTLLHKTIYKFMIK